MEWNKLRIALYLGEAMFARRTLMQLATKLAIGLGALFLVGVLLAAIPNHRAPVVSGASPEPGRETRGIAPTMMPATRVVETNTPRKNAVLGRAHKQATTAKAAASTR